MCCHKYYVRPVSTVSWFRISISVGVGLKTTVDVDISYLVYVMVVINLGGRKGCSEPTDAPTHSQSNRGLANLPKCLTENLEYIITLSVISDDNSIFSLSTFDRVGL